MLNRWFLSVAACLALVGQAGSQSATAPQELTFRVSSSQGWVDTGLDLQAGDTIKISASQDGQSAAEARACDPAGSSPTSTAGELPLPGAPTGALIARLHAHGASPLLVGAGKELHAEEASHLYLGLNIPASAPCKGSITVRVEITSAQPATNPTSEQTTRGQQLKSQLSTAAQVFMSGQFGSGKLDSDSKADTATAAAVPAPVPLNISIATLDANLRKNIDGLPRRVNDQFNNLGDMVNFVIVGSQQELQDALAAADWHVADTNNKKAVLNALMETYNSKDYLAMPMSTLYLFGRRQDFGYEMAEPIAMVASRHHFRIWKAPFTYSGHDVWVGAGTHDIGFAKDKRNHDVTHKIDPAVDDERDNIGSSLQKANKAKSLIYYLPPDPVQDAKNATGDGYHSDGRLLVIFLQ